MAAGKRLGSRVRVNTPTQLPVMSRTVTGDRANKIKIPAAPIEVQRDAVISTLGRTINHVRSVTQRLRSDRITGK